MADDVKIFGQITKDSQSNFESWRIIRFGTIILKLNDWVYS